MEPTPTAPSPKVPASQRDAQETVLKYLQQTVDLLPKGSSLDGARLTVGTGVVHCEDEPTGENSPIRFEDWRDVMVPVGTDSSVTVANVGDDWQRLGWQVLERDGYPKPNRFGYTPDGYILQIKVRDDAGKSMSLVAASPCFPGNLRDKSLPRNPPLITQSMATG